MASSKLIKGIVALAVIGMLVAAGWMYSSNQVNPSVAPVDEKQQVNPIAIVNTTMGDFSIELYEKEFREDKKYDSIRLVENFKDYAERGFYDGLIIHGVSPWSYNKTKSLIWTGEYYANLTEKKPIFPPIKYGKRTDVLFGLKHTDLAVSWFDTWNITSTFYICNGDWSNSGNQSNAWKEPGLDISDPVFGKIVSGVDVIRKIGSLGHHSEINETGDPNLGYVPNQTVVINSIYIHYPASNTDTVYITPDIFMADRITYSFSAFSSFMSNL